MNLNSKVDLRETNEVIEDTRQCGLPGGNSFHRSISAEILSLCFLPWLL